MSDVLDQLEKFVDHIGSGKLEPLLIINKGKIIKMRLKGLQTYLYNRSIKDANDNTQAIKHISQRINSALKGEDTRELNFNVTFNQGKITRVAWESDFFLSMPDEIDKT